MRIALALLTSVILASSVHAQGAPSGTPPSLRLVHGVNKKKGEITFLVTVTRVVPVVVEEEVIVNGQAQKVTVTKYQTVLEQRFQAINAASSRVITTAGQQLPIDQVWKRVKANTVVAVSDNGAVPAAAYLKALSVDTLVIIPPPAALVPAPPVPAPKPKRLPPVKV
ncbi:MAG: hypothetical protein HYX68_24870 [Planctomycetes bacterium]|nr:hypothetical protein [Planctomycetota bacterium]